MRLRETALFVASLALAGCTVRPSFLPAPAKVLSGFQALRQPRPELPVGALWIDGYGLYGEGTFAENLETVKTLSTATLDGGVQATLSLGILQFLDLDPSLHNKITARLNDVSIVRVKEMTKLGGPAGQWRVYEALKAGSITVTVSKDVGLDIELRAAEQNLPVFGHGTTGRLSTFTIEARDAFFAVRIARLVPASAPSAIIRLDRDGRARVRFGKLVAFVESAPGEKQNCGAMTLTYAVDGSQLGATHKLSDAGDAPLDAPIMLAGALYDGIVVTRTAGHCGQLQLRLRGVRIETLSPKWGG